MTDTITLPRATVQAALDILDAIELIEGPMYVSACRELRTALAQPQAEPVDSMGMPLSCGKPLCSPGDHHPLCTLAQPQAEPALIADEMPGAGSIYSAGEAEPATQSTVGESVYYEVCCKSHPTWMRVDKPQYLEYTKNGWMGRSSTPPPQPRKPLRPQSPCEMTVAENRMFRLGWLECEAAHGIGGQV